MVFWYACTNKLFIGLTTVVNFWCWTVLRNKIQAVSWCCTFFPWLFRLKNRGQKVSLNLVQLMYLVRNMYVVGCITNKLLCKFRKKRTLYSIISVCYTVVPTDANKSKDTIKNLAPDITKAFWHCWQTICTKVLAGSEPSYQWQLYAASITDPLCNRVFVNFHNNLVYSFKVRVKLF